MHVLVPMETESGCPGTGVKGSCEAEDGVLGTERRSPVRATNALNYESLLHALKQQLFSPTVVPWYSLPTVTCLLYNQATLKLQTLPPQSP